MISLTTISTILIIHWFSDFILQSDWMAQNKSKSNHALQLHILAYTLGMSTIYLFVDVSTYLFTLWLCINGLFHGVTDYVTSRISSKLWKQGEVHWFFVVIGFDQLLHLLMLLLSFDFIVLKN